MWFIMSIKKYYYLAVMQNFNEISTSQHKFHSIEVMVDERFNIYILYSNKYVNSILYLLLLDYNKIV